MKTIMLVFGTRPEAIKMCPLVNELKERKNINTVVCVTGQHRQMLDQVLEAFRVKPDYDLSIMKDKQTLFDVTVNIMQRIKGVLEEVKPDVVLVHGDTSTTFVTALSCFYLQIPVGHVEAGLRTYNIYSPYPEEFNRQAVGILAKYNFAPTELSRDNLIREGKTESSIYVTGNTAIDALKTTVRENYTHPELEWAEGSRLIMLTAHRRENLGDPMHNMFRAIRRVMDEHPDVKAIYPIHMNPVVRKAAEEELGGCDRIHIIEPLEVLDFHNFLARSYMILTDSGGIQEEAPSLGTQIKTETETVTASVLFFFPDRSRLELHTFFMFRICRKRRIRFLTGGKGRPIFRMSGCRLSCFCSCFTYCRPLKRCFMVPGRTRDLPMDGRGVFSSH